MSVELVSLGRRIHHLAVADGEAVRLVFVPERGPTQAVTARELDDRSTQLARLLVEHGVGPGDRVAIGLRNSPEHVIAALASWKAGAGILTMRWDVPDWERDRLLEAARPVVLVSDKHDVLTNGIRSVDVGSTSEQSTEPLPDVVVAQPMAIPSGGSTGASKAIVVPIPGAIPPGYALGASYAMFGIEPIERHLVFAPMYHGNPLIMVHSSLFDGHVVILHERFVAEQVVASIIEHRPNFMTLAPTMMKRLLDVPGIEQVDWSSFHMILHGTAPCPEWLKRAFIDLVGAERLWEIFASTEMNGSIIVRGDEWLEHPGTIGRPAPNTELKILGEDGSELGPGEVGEIYMRPKGSDQPAFEYLGGDKPKVTSDGYVSVGDLGFTDEDGYVYSADRRTDLIISGGANVVPAEVEAAIGEHPKVRDVAVIGLPDEEWGKRVHAVVVPTDPADPPTEADLAAHCGARLARYKVPKSFEIASDLPRTEMFKIRRSQLVAERT